MNAAAEIASDTVAPFAVSIVGATLLALFQIIIARRIAVALQDDSTTKTALWTLYGICASVIGLFLSEASKIALFGLTNFQKNQLTGFMYIVIDYSSALAVSYVAIFITEVTRVIVTGVIFLRLSDLVVPAKGIDPLPTDIRVRVIYLLSFFRLIFPVILYRVGILNLI